MSLADPLCCHLWSWSWSGRHNGQAIWSDRASDIKCLQFKDHRRSQGGEAWSHSREYHHLVWSLNTWFSAWSMHCCKTVVIRKPQRSSNIWSVWKAVKECLSFSVHQHLIKINKSPYSTSNLFSTPPTLLSAEMTNRSIWFSVEISKPVSWNWTPT